MTTVAFCEIDPYCQAVLRKHWPGVPIFEDVRKLTKSDVSGVDVICGGFPCQDISVAGKGAGIDGARSGLWSEYARLIGEIRPKFVIVENVAALLGRGIERVLGDLSQIGYDAEWHVISAADVGAPHLRERVWIVAYPNNGQRERSGQEIQAGRHAIGLGGEVVADAKSERWRKAGIDSERSSEWTAGCSDVLANAPSTQREGGWVSRGIYQEHSNISGSGWWEVESAVGRVANGISNGSHRLRSLGNAVVPQIPEIIGRAIMSAYTTLP